jgi:hypothetical protein
VRSVLSCRASPERRSREFPGCAHPVAGIPLIYEKGGQRTPIYVFAYDTAGAPRHLAAGRHIEGKQEIVADSALASKYGLSVGSEVRVLGVTFKIVGLSTGTVSMINPYVFVRYVDLVDLYLSGQFGDASTEPSLLSFLLIEVDPKADPRTVRDSIDRAVPNVAVFSRQELGDNNVKMGRRMFGPIVSLLVAIAYLIGALVVGLTVYASVLDRASELVTSSGGWRQRIPSFRGAAKRSAGPASRWVPSQASAPSSPFVKSPPWSPQWPFGARTDASLGTP